MEPQPPATAGAPAPASPSVPSPEDEVVDICRDLLRIDSSNYGDGSGPGERTAAEHVAGLLAEVGLEPAVLESRPGRTSLVVRLEGADGSRPPLLVHGHLDVVPARADDWQLPPFAGEERDGCLWGRGAVDMKDMDAMIIANVRHLVRTGRKPARELVVAFTADEEAGGVEGAHWLVDHHPALFEGVTEAVSEVGGFSVQLGGHRAYLLQTAEKGILWLRLTARGRAGHGSQINEENAVTRLAAAVARVGAHRWPREITPTVREFLTGVSAALGVTLPLDDPDAVAGALGPAGGWVGATLQNTANPSVLEAGYKHNVIPGSASALVDCRYLPGRREELLATVAELAGPDVEVEIVHEDIALEAPFRHDLVDAMAAALRSEDPDALMLPYCLAGGTDNKAFKKLGILGYGFAPLRLPAGLDFAGMFHGVDERVPLDSLRFGARVMQTFLQSC